MLTRRFGKTGLQTTVLTLGAMRIPPMPGESPEATQERTNATLRHALDLGINHIETARGYGPSEEQIGRAIERGVIRRDEFILTTKIGPTETAAEFVALIRESLTRLQVEFIDNLDLHGLNTDEIVAASLKPGGPMDGAREAVRLGLVGHVGFSTHGPLETILGAVRSDAFESVNLHYYYMNQYNRPAVMEAAARDMGVFIISPADKGGRLFDPPARLVELCSPLTPLALNQRWLLSQPEVHTLSLGMASPAEFEPHLHGLSGEPLTDAEAAAVARLDAAAQDLAPNWCSFCHQCLPCPEGIHIPEVLRLRNMAAAYGMADFGRYRYGMFERRDPETGGRTGGAGHWFPGLQGDFCTDCGECVPRCPLNLPVSELVKQTHSALVGEAGRRLWG